MKTNDLIFWVLLAVGGFFLGKWYWEKKNPAQASQKTQQISIGSVGATISTSA